MNLSSRSLKQVAFGLFLVLSIVLLVVPIKSASADDPAFDGTDPSGWPSIPSTTGIQPEEAAVQPESVYHLMLPLVTTGAEASNDEQARSIIEEYLISHSLAIEPGTPEYLAFLKDVLFEVHPDLTEGPNRDIVVSYALAQLRLISEDDSPVPWASLEQNSEAEVSPDAVSVYYNRTAAVDYALTWASNGSQKRNSAYPNFSNDCTNFVSQALKAGGYGFQGNHDGCTYESTQGEWYVYRNSSPSLTCWGSNRDWLWSTGWATAHDFMKYYGQYSGRAVAYGYANNKEALSLLISRASIGDIVHIQVLSGGIWNTFHSMIVTQKVSGTYYTADAKMTYHSGPSNLDVVNRSLRSIASGYSATTNRFVLVNGWR
jgi:hypothetical protein